MLAEEISPSNFDHSPCSLSNTHKTGSLHLRPSELITSESVSVVVRIWYLFTTEHADGTEQTNQSTVIR